MNRRHDKQAACRWKAVFGCRMVLPTVVALSACGCLESDGGGNHDRGDGEIAADSATGSDESSSSNPDLDSATDVGSEDAGTQGACLASISGRILKNGTEGMVAGLAVCIGEQICSSAISTDEDGSFVWEYPRPEGRPCVSHDFERDWIHMEIFAPENPEDYAGYAFVRKPTRPEISDQGETDYDLDVGTLALYEIPEKGAVYNPAAGASVDLLGLAFELEPSGLVKRPLGVAEDRPLEHEHQVHVFSAPLDEWHPPFVETVPDLLYYLAPHWAKIAEPGLVLSIDPPDGWVEGDAGTLRLLGSSTPYYPVDEGPLKTTLIYRDEEGLCINTDERDESKRVDNGVMTKCGTAVMTDGRIVTSPIPRFAWVAVYRQD